MRASRHEDASGQTRDPADTLLSALAEALSEVIFRWLTDGKRPTPRGGRPGNGGSAGAGKAAEDEKG